MNLFKSLFGKKEVVISEAVVDVMDNLKGKSYIYQAIDGKKFIGEYAEIICEGQYYYYIEGCSLILDQPAKVLRETTSFEDSKLNWIREAHQNNYCIRFISLNQLKSFVEEKKSYYVNNDNNSNDGVEYTFLNESLHDAKFVKTGERKKAVEVLNIPTVRVQKGELGGETYTSKFGHGTVKGLLVRIEDTPNYLKVVLNTESNHVCFNHKIATAY
jgi:hypothetical protein